MVTPTGTPRRFDQARTHETSFLFISFSWNCALSGNSSSLSSVPFLTLQDIVSIPTLKSDGVWYIFLFTQK